MPLVVKNGAGIKKIQQPRMLTFYLNRLFDNRLKENQSSETSGGVHSPNVC